MAKKIPVALTIAGSDSGGGAGIEADLRAFWAHGVHGCAAITAITAQNPFGVGQVQGVAPEVLRDQLERVATAFDICAMKTGMLLNADLIAVVEAFAEAHPEIQLVVDPVMVATSGARLLDDDAVAALYGLLHRATLITPNLPEAAALLNWGELKSAADLRDAARELAFELKTMVLVKGGHAARQQSVDAFSLQDGTLLMFEGPRVARPRTTHGTGCAFSAAITANLALGKKPEDAIKTAKAYVTNLLASGISAGKASVYGFSSPRYSEKDVSVEAY